MTHDKPAKIEPAVRELAQRLREHGYEIVHVSGAPPGSGGGHVELYYGTFHVGQMTRGESGEWEVAFSGSGEAGPEPDPGQQVPEHRQNPATMYFAYCPLNSHEPGLPGVTKDGRWYGGLVETHEAALTEANAHGHGEAVVETYHR